MNDVDLLLLDMIMAPGMADLDTFETIRAIRPDLKAVIASDVSRNDRVRTLQEIGAKLYIE